MSSMGCSNPCNFFPAVSCVQVSGYLGPTHGRVETVLPNPIPAAEDSSLAYPQAENQIPPHSSRSKSPAADTGARPVQRTLQQQSEPGSLLCCVRRRRRRFTRKHMLHERSIFGRVAHSRSSGPAGAHWCTPKPASGPGARAGGQHALLVLALRTAIQVVYMCAAAFHFFTSYSVARDTFLGEDVHVRRLLCFLKSKMH